MPTPDGRAFMGECLLQTWSSHSESASERQSPTLGGPPSLHSGHSPLSGKANFASRPVAVIQSDAHQPSGWCPGNQHIVRISSRRNRLTSFESSNRLRIRVCCKHTFFSCRPGSTHLGTRQLVVVPHVSNRAVSCADHPVGYDPEQRMHGHALLRVFLLGLAPL